MSSALEHATTAARNSSRGAAPASAAAPAGATSHPLVVGLDLSLTSTGMAHRTPTGQVTDVLTRATPKTSPSSACPDGQSEPTSAVVLVCQRYGLDPILKHVVLVEGNVYVTRDGLLHVAHSSGQLDGIDVEAAEARALKRASDIAIATADERDAQERQPEQPRVTAAEIKRSKPEPEPVDVDEQTGELLLTEEPDEPALPTVAQPGGAA